MIPCYVHVYLNALTPSVYINGSGWGLQLILQTLGWKFGVPPLLGSGAIS